MALDCRYGPCVTVYTGSTGARAGARAADDMGELDKRGEGGREGRLLSPEVSTIQSQRIMMMMMTMTLIKSFNCPLRIPPMCTFANYRSRGKQLDIHHPNL